MHENDDWSRPPYGMSTVAGDSCCSHVGCRHVPRTWIITESNLECGSDQNFLVA